MRHKHPERPERKRMGSINDSTTDPLRAVGGRRPGRVESWDPRPPMSRTVGVRVRDDERERLVAASRKSGIALGVIVRRAIRIGLETALRDAVSGRLETS